MFAAMAGGRVNNIDNNHVLLTSGQYTALTRPFPEFNRHLLSKSLLPVRLRQIAILRVAWLHAARYKWASHLRMSLRLGLTAEDFAAVKRGTSDTHWLNTERTVLCAVDQLCERQDLDEEHWRALSSCFDRR